VSAILAWTVIIPLTGAALTFLLGRRFTAPIGLLTAGATLVAAGALVFGVWTEGALRHDLGGWGAPLGIDLIADGLSAVMIIMTAVVGALVSWYGWSYFGKSTEDEADERSRWSPRDSFWPLWLFLWTALNVIFLSGDIFNIYVGLELMGLAAVALVILAKERAALVAGMRYFLAALIGSLAYLMGVALIYATTSTLEIGLAGARLESETITWAAFALMTAGLMLKTALFPLHFWLPPAHASAPAPVSAILSALVIKASFYLVLRFWIDLFPELSTRMTAQFIGLLGSAAIVWGSIQAIRQTRLKLLIAYSTVAQVGYLCLLFPLLLPSEGMVADGLVWNFTAFDGGIYQALSHALAKAAMFMAAGTIIYSMGQVDQMPQMGGVAGALPVTTFAFGLAGVSLMGLPPSGGFVAKWLLLNGAVDTGQWWWAAIILLGGLLAAVYVFLFLGQAFRPADEGVTFQPVPRGMELSALLLAIGSLLLGLRATEILELLRIGIGPAP
jgi:multicomponent Na+:H+ antiporter subunit D